MKKHLLIILAALIVSACNSRQPERVLKEELHPILLKYYTDRAKKFELKIDSVNILRIDTLTQKRDSLDSFWRLRAKMTSMQSKINESKSEVEDQVKMMRLTRGISVDLYSNAKSEYEEQMEILDGLVKKYSSMLDRLKSLDILTRGNSLDSLKPRGYIVMSNIKARDMQNVAGDVDSATLMMDMSKRIKLKQEFEN